jgi:hypothetical protein
MDDEMSACLFTLKFETLKTMPDKELKSLLFNLLKVLAVEPDKDNKFQCDRWAGYWDTLTKMVFIETKRNWISDRDICPICDENE